jgi:hypothetical protein
MNLQETELNPSPLEKLLDYHRLLRIVDRECSGVLDEESNARLAALILDRIQQLEFPAAMQLDEARDARGFRN